jgi:CheY-specific phosphatase CheX
MESIFETSTYEAMTTQIVCDVFDTMLQYPIAECEEDYSNRSTVITAAIFFAGLWKGAAILECSEAEACFFCNRLMGIPQPAHIDDDVCDAMGELANMIGGNLKSVLPPGVSLSMPSVVEGSAYAYRICGSNQTSRFAFRGAAGVLWVTLVQMRDAGDKTTSRE